MHFFAAFLFHFFFWFCFDRGGTPISCTHTHTRPRTYYLYLSLFHPSINGCVLAPHNLFFMYSLLFALPKKKKKNRGKSGEKMQIAWNTMPRRLLKLSALSPSLCSVFHLASRCGFLCILNAFSACTNTGSFTLSKSCEEEKILPKSSLFPILFISWGCRRKTSLP